MRAVAVFVESLLAMASAPTSLRIVVIDNAPAMRRMLEDLVDPGGFPGLDIHENVDLEQIANIASRTPAHHEK